MSSMPIEYLRPKPNGISDHTRRGAFEELVADIRKNELRGEGSLPELSLSLNLRRRHLNESKRAMVAARLAKLMQANRPARGANLAHGKLLRSHDQAAAAVNVSLGLLMHARRS